MKSPNVPEPQITLSTPVNSLRNLNEDGEWIDDEFEVLDNDFVYPVLRVISVTSPGYYDDAFGSSSLQLPCAIHFVRQIDGTLYNTTLTGPSKSFHNWMLTLESAARSNHPSPLSFIKSVVHIEYRGELLKRNSCRFYAHHSDV